MNPIGEIEDSEEPGFYDPANPESPYFNPISSQSSEAIDETDGKSLSKDNKAENEELLELEQDDIKPE